MDRRPAAAILTVGTELTAGLRQDTNGGEIARALAEAGYEVRSMTSVPDDPELVETTLRALVSSYSLVIVTGGLGPTHDDITREAAARALGRGLHTNQEIADGLAALALHHAQPESRLRMLRQADVIDGARVLPAATGTAPGQLVVDGDATLVLLPGPPSEMRPLLALALANRTGGVQPARLRCTGITESDAQHLVEPAIAEFGVDFTLLAAPGDVEVVLFARPGHAAELPIAAAAARMALGGACYSTDGSSLAETVIALAHGAQERIAVAESCTGGLVSAEITNIAGASNVFCGGVISYADDVKAELLNVPPGLLAQFGAVSEQTARAMAEGALLVPGATISVAITGIAGPTGGSNDKPVGLVWFGVARAGGAVSAHERRFRGDREMIRRRATLTALDLLRRELREG